MILHAQEHVNHIDFAVVGHYSVLQASEHKFATFASASGHKRSALAVSSQPSPVSRDRYRINIPPSQCHIFRIVMSQIIE